MSDATITVKYSCLVCGITRREVSVGARDPALDVVEWLNRVIRPAIGSDHIAMSPQCSARAFDLMIPLGGPDQPLGSVIKH